MSQKFSVTDYKGARDVSIETTAGELVIVAGRNGSGKSSFIDGISELFDPHGVKLTPKPIRDGADSAQSEFIDEALGIRLVRTWKKNDAGKLEAYALDGAKYSKPSDVVAGLTGGLIFDPVRFLQLDEKKQRDELLAKVQLPFDLAEVEAQKAGAVARRLEHGREVKRLQGALSSLPAAPKGTPAEEVSSSALLDEIRVAESEARAVSDLRSRVASRRSRIESIEAQLRTLQSELAAETSGLSSDEFELSMASEPVDVAALQAQLGDLESINAAVRAGMQRATVAKDLEAAEAAHKAADAELDAIEKQKRDGLSGAVWPVDGLGIDDTGVTFNGIPFKQQVNSAQQRIVAFHIATAGDPDLKLVIIKDGDLLDGDSLAQIRELARDRAFTVLVERDRDDSRQVGFEIVEGSLVD
ncbi:hypothetical protein [Pseudoclavibacter helvolus]